jgi:hypothetical protein
MVRLRTWKWVSRLGVCLHAMAVVTYDHIRRPPVIPAIENGKGFACIPEFAIQLNVSRPVLFFGICVVRILI